MSGSLLFEAPFGIHDLMNGIVRPNKKQIKREIYDAKAARWITVWPGLSVVTWDEEDSRIP